MIRKTRLLSKAGVMLVRVEIFDDQVLSSTRFRMSTLLAGQTFTRLDAALKAFRETTRRRVEGARLKKAA